MQHEAPERALRIQITQVKSSRQWIGREKEIQADQQPSRAGDPGNFAEGRIEVGKVPEPVTDEDRIEGGVCEGQFAGIGADRALDALLPCELQHTVGEIDRTARAPG